MHPNEFQRGTLEESALSTPNQYIAGRPSYKPVPLSCCSAGGLQRSGGVATCQGRSGENLSLFVQYENRQEDRERHP